MTLSHSCLSRLWRRGFRNGNWRKLNHYEKALYLASLSLAKIRGKIVNSRLILELKYIMGKLRETVGERLMQASYQRAMKLYERFETIGLFRWAPLARSWFDEPSFILWLGLCSQTVTKG